MFSEFFFKIRLLLSVILSLTGRLKVSNNRWRNTEEASDNYQKITLIDFCNFVWHYVNNQNENNQTVKNPTRHLSNKLIKCANNLTLK